MTILLCTNASPSYDLQNGETWADCLNFIRRYVRHFVYSAHIACWHGQEEDIIDDVVQETVRRILERSQHAECLEALPIYSLERISLIIARNYCIDKLRRDRRLQRISSDYYCLEGASSREDQMDSFETAIELVSQEELFTRLAYAIARFPEKRRRALLIDLANRMYFDTELTLLQKAFLAAGIDLHLYQQTVPFESVERTRHTALMSLAYKQVAMVMREFILDK